MCLFVSAEAQPCTAPQTCQGVGVVAVGAACGCPANGTTLNTGCATSAINATIASATDNAVLRCEMVGACKIWRILVNCQDQSLTAGTDTVTGNPACVCKAPVAPTVYVDPDPPMATFMTNNPTGAIDPPACRFRTIGGTNSALAFVTATGNAAYTRVVARHESSSNVHFTAEPMPLNIPAGIEVTTADGPSFNPSHYTIDLGTGGGLTPRVTITNGSVLSGFTLLGAAAGNMAGGAVNGTSLLGCAAATATTTPPAAGASAHHLALIGNGAALTDATGNVGIEVTGNCVVTSDLVTINSVATAITVDHTAATDLAVFTGTAITGTAIGNVGVNVMDANSRVNLAGSTFTVSGLGGDGLNVTSGIATLGTTALILTSVDATSNGIFVSGAQATAAVTMTGGSVTLSRSAAAPAHGVNLTNGTGTFAGVGINVGANTRGIIAQNASQLTVNGASVLTTDCKTIPTADPCGTAGDRVTIADPDGTGPLTAVSGSNASGIFIPGGATHQAVGVTVGGTTNVNGFLNGIESNSGSLTLTGTVVVTGNANDGISLHGAPDTTTTVVSITGATVSNNGADGVDVDTQIPATLTTTTIRNNTQSGIEVLRSQNAAQMGYRLLVIGSTISGNWEQGIELSGESGKVGARIENSTISGNGLVGLRVTEDFNDGGADTTFTEVLIEGNIINGNLTRATTAVAGWIAGGILFDSPVNGGGTVGAGETVLVRLGSFLGNRVFGNGRHEIGFNIAQDNGLAWNLSSNAAGVDQGMVCSAASRPNFVYCYDTVPGEDLGIARANTPVIDIKIKGMHFQNLPPAGGRDFSAGIAEPMVLTPEPTSGIFLSCSAQAGCAATP